MKKNKVDLYSFSAIPSSNGRVISIQILKRDEKRTRIYPDDSSEQEHDLYRVLYVLERQR